MRESDKILHEKFVSCGAKAKEWTRKCLLLLPEIEKREIWRKKGFGNIYEYAAKLAGISRNAVDDALRIFRKIEDKPALQKIAEEKGIGAIRPVATIATCETDAFWAEKAQMMSKNTLETYVREIRKTYEMATVRTDSCDNQLGTYNASMDNTSNISTGDAFVADISASNALTANILERNMVVGGTSIVNAPAGNTSASNISAGNDSTGNLSTTNPSIEKFRPRTARTERLAYRQAGSGVRLLCQSSQPENMSSATRNRTSTIIMDLDPEVAEKLTKLKGTGTWNDLIRTLLEQHEAQIEAQKPVPVETESRHIPAAIKKYVLAKTNGTCAFPGCTKPHSILHHTKRFALSKCHDPDHLAPLCTAHERLAHLSLIESEEHSASHWKIRLEPETHDLKHMIDQRVAAHRQRKILQPQSDRQASHHLRAGP